MGHSCHCLQEKHVQKAQPGTNTGDFFFLKSMQHSTKLCLLLVLIEVDYHVIYKWISGNLCHTLTTYL
jgi:hypothetical protein